MLVIEIIEFSTFRTNSERGKLLPDSRFSLKHSVFANQPTLFSPWIGFESIFPTLVGSPPPPPNTLLRWGVIELRIYGLLGSDLGIPPQPRLLFILPKINPFFMP